ncbi:MAG: PHP domain-containing protein [Clostridiales bacterium]|nr:PHP domain-containing protein [Clostridiales bacterium]
MHIHSSASDGCLDVVEIIDLARANRNLRGIAITDHDTVAGLPRAIEYAKKVEYTLIAGIELSTEYGDYDVHILGYWIDAHKLANDGRLAQMGRARAERCREMARRLEDLGMPVDVEAVIAGVAKGGVLGRPHMAQAMVDAGYASSIKEAFGKWLGRGLPAYVPRLKFTPREALAMVIEAGGAAVLAHPGVGVPDHLAQSLPRHGLTGIEVYHSEHNREEEKKYLQMARRYRLAAMGGSDFHQPGAREIGCHVTAPDQLHFLAKRRERQQAGK